MRLLNDEARCPGTDCPSAMNCRRFTERATGGANTPMSAFYLRREAGASGCDGFRAVQPVSTFEQDHTEEVREMVVETEGGEA